MKAVVLNLISLGAVMGLATWFWQEGNGSHAVFGIEATGAMTFWLPPLIFAFLFGLSMDYEVFILSRMREEYDRSGSTQAAVVRGIGRTGRLVTSAALILFFAFAALASAPGTDIKVFATCLGVGILIDATIVRAVLVPVPGRHLQPVELVATRLDRQDHASRALTTARARRARSGRRRPHRVSGPNVGARLALSPSSMACCATAESRETRPAVLLEPMRRTVGSGTPLQRGNG